jgi:hypothetical protein
MFAPTPRALGVAMAVSLGLGILIGWVAFHGGSAKPAALNAQQVQTVPLPLNAQHVPQVRVALVPIVNRALGVRLGRPPGWRASVQHRVIKLLSPDQSMSLGISAPSPPNQAKQLRRFDKAQLVKLFKPAKVIGRTRGKIGPVAVLTSEIEGTNQRHQRIRILTTAASSAFRTYSIEAFSAPTPPALRLAELQAILRSFRFFRPR